MHTQGTQGKHLYVVCTRNGNMYFRLRIANMKIGGKSVMQKLILYLGHGIRREIICPYSDKNAIKEWLRQFYPIGCKFIRESEA